MNKTRGKLLLSLPIKIEPDVVLARRRARQIAYLVGFDAQNQTRISTAVSEITRNAFMHAKGGRLNFSIEDERLPYRFVITMIDNGPGIPDIDQILSGNNEHAGLVGASKLVDKFLIENGERSGTIIRMEKNMADRMRAFSDAEINELANALSKLVADNPIDEVHQQNQELLEALDLLSKKQVELDELNDCLEAKVKERTSELLESNAYLEKARDEAILANKIKSQFVANISHEIRTPMSGVLGATELFLSMKNLDPEGEQLINLANHSARGLMTVIDDLLDFSKLESGKTSFEESAFCISVLVDDVCSMFAGQVAKKGLGFRKEIEPELIEKHLIGDPVLTKRVLQNLVNNAVKFTAQGSIVVSCQVKERTDDTLTVRMSVTDTGIGISAADQARLFQPFVQADGSDTRKYGGTGLGLAICKGYAMEMQAVLDCSSTVNEGSEFWIDIPLRERSDESKNTRR